MGFLNFPLFWLGALAISVPIIIHLLNKRQFERVTWAAMRFLKVSVEQNQRRIKVEDILLLLLRCLMLLLLGMALARPILGCSAANKLLGSQDVTAIIVLDNSYSMSGTDGVKSRFEQAKIAADQILNTMPNGSSVAVILASDIANPVIPEPTHDLLKVRRALADARLSSRGSDLYPAIELALKTLKGRPAIRKEIQLFTDGQLVAWKRIADIQKLLEVDRKDVKSNVVFVGGHEEENVAVTQLRMASGIAAVNTELRIEAEVKNYGARMAENVRVTLRVDSADASDEQTIGQIPAGGSKMIGLRAKLRTEGFHTITAAIPADHLPADDVRTIAVRAIARVRVLLVDGTAGGKPQDSDWYYLRTALVSLPSSLADPESMAVTMISPSDLDTTRLDKFDAVILANVADFSKRTLDSFADYLRRGGGLVIFPGDSTSPGFYNENLAQTYHFLPATFGAAHGDAGRTDKYSRLQDKSFQHPIAAIWSDSSRGSPSSADFYKAFELKPAIEAPAPGDKYATEAGALRIVLSFGNGVGDDSLDGKPAVMERAWGLGRVVQFASAAGTGSKWNTLAVASYGGIFLPLMDRILASIVQRQDEALNIRVGSTFVFHPGDEFIGKEVLFFKPGQKEEATESRQIEVPRAGSPPTVAYDQTELAGEYLAKLPDGSLVKFAAQIDSSDNESSLDELSKSQEDQLAQVATFTHWSPGQSLGAQVEKARTGTELWTQLAWIVLALAAGEMILAQWFSRTK